MRRWSAISIVLIIFLLGLVLNLTSIRADSISGCSVENIDLLSHSARWEDNNRLRLVGELKNTCLVAVGVQIQVVVRDKNGVLIDSKEFWPASTRNIPPGSTQPIGYTISKDRRASSYEIRVVDLTIW